MFKNRKDYRCFHAVGVKAAKLRAQMISEKTVFSFTCSVTLYGTKHSDIMLVL